MIGGRYQIVVKGIDLHEPGSLNPSQYDGLLIMSQGDQDLDFLEEDVYKRQDKAQSSPMLHAAGKMPL